MQRKVISLPTDDSKFYRQILAFMNFMLNLTPQERDVLAEIIKLDNEYEALPVDKRAKFILSTDMRKEIRELLEIEEKQFNVILSRLKKKTFGPKLILDENNILHKDLKFKPDSEGFRFEVNFVMTKFTEQKRKEAPLETTKEEAQHPKTPEEVTPPTEYKYDASKAPVLEEEEFDITITNPDE